MTAAPQSGQCRAHVRREAGPTRFPGAPAAALCLLATAKRVPRSWLASPGVFETLDILPGKVAHPANHLAEDDAGEHQAEQEDDLVVTRNRLVGRAPIPAQIPNCAKPSRNR